MAKQPPAFIVLYEGKRQTALQHDDIVGIENTSNMTYVSFIRDGKALFIKNSPDSEDDKLLITNQGGTAGIHPFDIMNLISLTSTLCFTLMQKKKGKEYFRLIDPRVGKNMN
jgi:hypothetical protein